MVLVNALSESIRYPAYIYICGATNSTKSKIIMNNIVDYPTIFTVLLHDIFDAINYVIDSFSLVTNNMQQHGSLAYTYVRTLKA